MMGFRPQAALVVGMGAALVAPWVASQPLAAGRGEAVYRCPGPPVVYTDAISADEAKARGCAVLGKAEGKPVAVAGKPARGDVDHAKPVASPVLTLDDIERAGIRHTGTLAPAETIRPNWAAADSYLAAPASAPAPAKLGPLDAWRYRRCQENAAQAPTSVGVYQGMRLCREQFGQ